MNAVMHMERDLGHSPRDISAENRGYDIESIDRRTNRLRFIEVKGRVADAETVTVTRNEVVTGINSSEGYILAIVLIDCDNVHMPIYVREPFQREPDFDAASVNYSLKDLMARGKEPS